MVVSLTLIILAFAWLMYETKFLTIRLPYGKPPAPISVDGLISAMIAMIIGICLLPLTETISDAIEECLVKVPDKKEEKG